MKFDFILNSSPVSVQCDPDLRLVQVLRDQFSLTGLKKGCLHGVCGSCLLFLGTRLVQSCLVPVFQVQDCTVLTIEGFSQSGDFRDIERGFAKAGVNPCGFCASSKVLATQALLLESLNPADEDIERTFSAILCRCTSYSVLVQGIHATAAIRRMRLNVR